jgi:hypothetical protein
MICFEIKSISQWTSKNERKSCLEDSNALKWGWKSFEMFCENDNSSWNFIYSDLHLEIPWLFDLFNLPFDTLPKFFIISNSYQFQYSSSAYSAIQWFSFSLLIWLPKNLWFIEIMTSWNGNCVIQQKYMINIIWKHSDWRKRREEKRRDEKRREDKDRINWKNESIEMSMNWFRLEMKW